MALFGTIIYRSDELVSIYIKTVFRFDLKIRNK